MTIYNLQGKQPYCTNCYLLISDDQKQAILIDGSVSPAQLQPLLDRHGAALRAVLLTHGHFDHVEQLAELRHTYGVPIYLSGMDAAMYGVDGTTEYPVCFDFSPELRPQMLSTPGHTPGSICLAYPGCVFCGDTLFAGSVGRTDLPGGDAAVLFDNLRLLCGFLQQQPGDCRLFPGHGEDTTFSREKQTNPFLIRVLR